MKVLVTGSEGFLGSAVSIAVASDKSQLVVCSDSLPHNKDLWRSTKGGQNISAFMKLDITQPDAIRRISAIKPEVVIHLAAIPNQRKCDNDSQTCLKTNIIGTYNTLAGAMQAGTKLFVLASSQIVYGKPRRSTITEEHPESPENLYGLTKLFVERLVGITIRKSEMKCMVLRYSSLYGKSVFMQTNDVVGRFVKSAFQEGVIRVIKPRNLQLPGMQEIDLLHVTDAATATALLVRDYPAIQESVFNVSSGKGTTVMTLARFVARLVKKKSGRNVQIVPVNSDQDEPERRVSSNRRLCGILGWTPRIDLETGVSEIVSEMSVESLAKCRLP
jgi:UDP-glucose 4-epimerase